MFRHLGVGSIPALCIDGQEAFANRVPTLDELYGALTTAAHTTEQRRLIEQAWDRASDEYGGPLDAPVPAPAVESSSPTPAPAVSPSPPQPASVPAEPLDAAQAVEVLRAIGHPLRFGIVQLLAGARNGDGHRDPCGSCNLMCTVRLRAVFGISAPDLHHHMKILKKAGIVETRRDHAWVYYQLRPGPLAGLSGALGGLTSAFADTREVLHKEEGAYGRG
jgi:ArsR family transcriptional regulator